MKPKQYAGATIAQWIVLLCASGLAGMGFLLAAVGEETTGGILIGLASVNCLFGILLEK